MSKANQKSTRELPARRRGPGALTLTVIAVIAVFASVTLWQGAQHWRTRDAIESAGIGQLTMTVYKSPACECCGKWVALMRTQGFTIDVVDRDDISAVKSRLGVPGSAGSCHTATIGGYVVEGHVPAQDIVRMLTERPAIVGIAAHGMPSGSPGMDGPSQRYTVVSFDRNGELKAFAER